MPDADGDEMTAFRMTEPSKGKKMYVELLGQTVPLQEGLSCLYLGSSQFKLGLKSKPKNSKEHGRWFTPRLLTKKTDGVFKQIGNLYVRCKPGTVDVFLTGGLFKCFSQDITST